MTKRFKLFLLAALAVLSANLSADIYKCTNANGEVLYTDQPCPELGVTQQEMVIEGSAIQLSGPEPMEQTPPPPIPRTTNPPVSPPVSVEQSPPPRQRFPETAPPRISVKNETASSRNMMKDLKGILIIALLVFPVAYFILKLLFRLQLPFNRLFFAFFLSIAASIGACIAFMEMYAAGLAPNTLELAKAGISGLTTLLIIPMFAKRNPGNSD